MNGWETVLAALGGTMLGLGLGLVVSARREAGLRKHLTQLHVRVRDVVLPVLERQADELGVTMSSRPRGTDAIDQSVALSSMLLQHTERELLAYSETVDVDRRELRVEDGG